MINTSNTEKSRHNSVYDCVILPLSKVHNRAGNITVVEGNKHIPFDIQRLYYLYDIPGGEDRGAHAHKELHQLVVAASGSFDVLLDDGENKKIATLNRPYFGLHVPPGIWAAEKSFSSGAVCLVLASHKYDAADYIRDCDAFHKYKNSEAASG
jgi:hypothetical protein